jgi:hypothetical protein
VRRTILVAIAALVLAPSAHAGQALTVGAAEDRVREPTLVGAKAHLSLLRLTGMRAVRITTIWAPGETAPTAAERTTLANVAQGATLSGVRVYTVVQNFGSRTTPLTEEARSQFAAYAAAVARLSPAFGDVIVGNEPNLNRFWLPQFGEDGSDVAAPAYLALLAQTYDAVKAAAPAVRLWGGALGPRGGDRAGTGRDTHSPTAFLRDLGLAYRASGRRAPVMDGLAFHPYTDFSAQPPEFAHPNVTTIALGDYPKLVALLAEAFDGTAQPGSTLPILYDEFGVESIVPESKAAAYSGTEPAATRPVDEATQADYYRRALALAFCQPNVDGMLLFHTQDEPALAGWQSGLYYVDGTPKSSLPAVREAILKARGGTIATCAGRTLTPAAQRLAWRQARVSFTCTVDCVYAARLRNLKTGIVVQTVGGRTPVDAPATAVSTKKLSAGRYRLELTLVAQANAGPPRVVLGPAFRR